MYFKNFFLNVPIDNVEDDDYNLMIILSAYTICEHHRK